MSTKVSIVTVSFNEIDGISQTIDSVASQTYAHIEFIVIDGGSTDGTVQVIRQKADKLSFWCSEQDDGIYDAMNKGLSKCTGDYVIFCNGGDYLANCDVVARMVKVAEDNDFPDLVYGDCATQSKSGLLIRSAHGPGFIRMGMPAAHESMLYKMDVIRCNNLRYDITYRIAADYKFTYEFVKASKTFAALREPVIVFADGGISSTSPWLGMMEANRVRREVGDSGALRRWGIIGMQCVALFLSTYAAPLYRFVRLRKSKN